MKKQLLAGIIGLTVVLGITGCGGSKSNSSAGSSSAKPVTLRMNVTTSEASVWQVAAKGFKKEVEEKTGGRY